MRDYFQVSPRAPTIWDSAINEYIDPKQIILTLETTNICNIQCTFCPHGIMRRKHGVMPESLFRKIIDEAASIGVRKVSLNGFGEPLCDKNLIQRIAYIKQKGINDIGFTTNGYLLTDAMLTKLFEAGLTRLFLSLAPKREYKQTRPKVDVEKFFDTLWSLRNNPYIQSISIKYTKTGISTPEEEKDFFDFIKKANMPIYGYYNKHNWNRSGEAGSPRDADASRASPYLCALLWHPYILWDGRVSCCCIDYESEVIVADANTQTVAEIINCDEIRTIRRNHLAGKFLKFCLTCNTPSVMDSCNNETLMSFSYLWRCAKIYFFHPESIVGYKPSVYGGLKLLAKVGWDRLVGK